MLLRHVVGCETFAFPRSLSLVGRYSVVILGPSLHVMHQLSWMDNASSFSLEPVIQVRQAPVPIRVSMGDHDGVMRTYPDGLWHATRVGDRRSACPSDVVKFEPKASAKKLVFHMIYGERDSPPSHMHSAPFVFLPWIALLSQANARVISKFCLRGARLDQEPCGGSRHRLQHVRLPHAQP